MSDSLSKMADLESNRIEQETTSELSCPQRCFYKLVNQATFSLVLFSGLSLTAAGVFKEQVNHDESEGSISYLTLNFSALLGFIMVLYSILGICLNWFGRISIKVRLEFLLHCLTRCHGNLRITISKTNRQSPFSVYKSIRIFGLRTSQLVSLDLWWPFLVI